MLLVAMLAFRLIFLPLIGDRFRQPRPNRAGSGPDRVRRLHLDRATCREVLAITRSSPSTSEPWCSFRPGMGSGRGSTGLCRDEKRRDDVGVHCSRRRHGEFPTPTAPGDFQALLPRIVLPNGGALLGQAIALLSRASDESSPLSPLQPDRRIYLRVRTERDAIWNCAQLPRPHPARSCKRGRRRAADPQPSVGRSDSQRRRHYCNAYDRCPVPAARIRRCTII